MNAVEIQGVSQRYGSMTVLHDLNLTLAEGEVLGLFGHNGAGKTTSMKLILGLLAPSEGQVKVLGRAPNDPQVRRQLGYLPENVTFYPQLSGRETLRHFARLKGAALSQVDELLEQVGLAHAADRRVKTYSKGMRQRLGLAQALLGEPKLLLLDEPTVGLDPIATQDLYLLIDRLRQRGTSIILCSHVLPGVEAHINRAAILARVACRPQAAWRTCVPRPVCRCASVPAASASVTAGCSAGPLPGTAPAASANRAWRWWRSTATNWCCCVSCWARGAEDIEIHQPSLEDLYRYYMERAGDVRAQEGRP